MFQVALQPEAIDDLQRGYMFYESQSEGLGNYFQSQLLADIESLKLFAGVHVKPMFNLHRHLSKRFPFAIYYALIENTAHVVAVLDCRRNPKRLRKDLASRRELTP